MAIDPTPPTLTPDRPATAAIENEFPAYRAIHPGAVLSLVLGLASVFCFTDLRFLLLVAASIAIGLIALRKIRRLPEILTGGVFARVGIASALVFGLSAVTHLVASEVLVRVDASRFARQFVEVIKSQPLNMTLWYQQPADYRRSKKPTEIEEEIRNTKNPMMGDPYTERTASVVKIKERLRGKGEEIHYVKIESTAIDGLTVYANALIDLDGPGSKDFPEKEQFALLEMVKGPGAGPNDWMIKEIRYPYRPASAVATVVKEKVDDGHGHGH